VEVAGKADGITTKQEVSMAKLSTAGWVAHNVGLSACLGGLLFGKLALNPNLQVLSDKSERGKVLNTTWNRYNAVNAASLGTAAATWFVGRAGISGDVIDDDARGYVLAKDVLFVASALSGLASIVAGRRLTAQAPDGAVPIESGTEPAAETPEEAAGLLRTVNQLGNLNIVLITAIIAVTTILSQKAGQSTKWSAVSRFLP
jgi:hypothetical protein